MPIAYHLIFIVHLSAKIVSVHAQFFFLKTAGLETREFMILNDFVNAVKRSAAYPKPCRRRWSQ